jgi:hypothetical protein
MGKRFKVGDHVTWTSEVGHVDFRGWTCQRQDYQSPFNGRGLQGHTHHASEDEPQYEIKSDKTDHIAMHKGAALKKLRAR